MADRNTPESFTLEEWRVEFNELATDVGDIASLPSTVNGQNVTDVIEAVVELESALSTVMFPTVIDFDDSTGTASERIKMGTDDDLQLYHDGNKSIINHTGTGGLELTSNASTLTFPAVGGTISTEGFGIALAIALG
tara:strand:- start:3909 stop:4319 length:411 start_codon:yes stop_codon:yes gene_type:complete